MGQWKDTLRDAGKEVLMAVADVIRNDADLAARFFQVAGHTDAQTLNGGQFKDNWGLSAMRARTVLVFLIAPVKARDGKDFQYTMDYTEADGRDTGARQPAKVKYPTFERRLARITDAVATGRFRRHVTLGDPQEDPRQVHHRVRATAGDVVGTRR